MSAELTLTETIVVVNDALSGSDGDKIDRLIAEHREGYGLVRDFYADPDIYTRDMERVIRRHWHCIGHESIIPNSGDFEMFKIDTETIIVSRTDDGSIHAFLNVCRHRGAEVCTKQKGNARFFVCPYHAWTYANDGSLKAARLMPDDFDRNAHGLKKLHVRLSEGLIFISFAEEPLNFDRITQVLKSTCGQYGWGDAKVAHRETYAVDANWKLAVENYVECYHCGPAHPEYSQTHALEQPKEKIVELNARMEERTKALGFEVVSANYWVNSVGGEEAIDAFRYALYDGISTGSEDGTPIAPLMGKFTAFDGGVTSVHLGGTSFLVCYPDHGMIYRFIPKTADSCEMELIWLVHKDAEEGKDYDFDKLTWLWKVTTAEDKKIIEHTSRGVRSRYFVPGPIAPMEYNELRYINWYLDEISRP